MLRNLGGCPLQRMAVAQSAAAVWSTSRQAPVNADDIRSRRVRLSMTHGGMIRAGLASCGWSFRVALRSQPIYASASLQPLINFSFALKPLDVPNFDSGVVSLDLPVTLCNAFVFEDNPRSFAHGHQYAVVRNRLLGGSIRLIQRYGDAGPSGEELIQ